MPWIEWAGLDMVSEHSLFRLPTRLTKDWHQFVAGHPGRNAVSPPSEPWMSSIMGNGSQRMGKECYLSLGIATFVASP